MNSSINWICIAKQKKWRHNKANKIRKIQRKRNIRNTIKKNNRLNYSVIVNKQKWLIKLLEI